MNSRTLLTLTLAGLCIIALGLGAATLTDTTESDRPAFGDGNEAPSSDDGEASGKTTGDGNLLGEPTAAPEDDACIAGYDITELTFVLIMLAVVASFVVLIYTGSLIPAIVAFPLLAVPLWFASILVFAFLGCPAPGAETVTEVTDQASFEEFETDSSENGGEETAPISVRLGLAGLVGAVLFALFLAGLYVQRRDSDESHESSTQGTVPDADRLGAVAGKTADDIEDDADLENAVYRAWKEMAEILSLESPETSTPADFAAAAHEAGLAEADVAELTELFESVRYGTVEATPEREQRAIAALRRIEETTEKERTEGQ